MKYLAPRLRERSTIAVLLTLLAGAVGWGLAPEQVDAIAAAVVVILTAVGVLTPEK